MKFWPIQTDFGVILKNFEDSWRIMRKYEEIMTIHVIRYLQKPTWPK